MILPKSKLRRGLLAAASLLTLLALGILLRGVGNDGGPGFDFDDLGGIAELVTALVTTVTVGVIAYEVFAARRDASTERTRGFQERYHGREFRSTASLAMSFFQARDARDCIDKIEAWHARPHAEAPCLPRTPPRGEDAPRAALNDVQQVAGFFEDLGTAYNRGDLTRGVIHDSFAVAPVDVFVTAWWYVCWIRGGRLLDEGVKLWEQWERMVKGIRAAGVVARSDPEMPAGLLCLPFDQESAPRGEWRRSRQLSEALDRHSADLRPVLDCLRESHPAIGSELPAGEYERRWRILLIPASIDTPPDGRWALSQAHASTLSRWLSWLSATRRIEPAIEALTALESRAARG